VHNGFWQGKPTWGYISVDRSSSTVFAMMKHKLQYMNERQRTLAQNVANANTPGYKSQDVKMDFDSILRAKSSSSVSLATTHSGHIKPKSSGMTAGGFKHFNPETSEITPNGNNVVLEEEVLKLQKNNMDYQMTTDLYKKMSALIKIGLGE
jgi:flagellar basal-body rod protein FlgB